MNINSQNLLNNLLYNNLSKNINLDIESIENTETENAENADNSFKYNNPNSFNLLTTKEELKLLLSSFNLPINKENLDLINLLIKNGISVNKDNIQLVSNTLKSFKNFPLEKALLFIENNITPNINTFKQLEKFISKDISLDSQIENLLNNLENIEDDKLSSKTIFNNTNLEQLVNNESDNIKNIKLEILNKIINNTKVDGNINYKNINEILDKIVTENKDILNQNLSKPMVLDKVIDFLFNDNLIVKPNKLNTIENLINNIPIEKTPIKDFEYIKNFVNKENFLSLEKEIFNIIKSDKDINLKLKNFIDNAKVIQDKIKYFNIEDTSNKDLEDFFTDLATITKNIKDNLQNINDSNSEILNKNVENLSKNIDFMSSLKDSMFLQIPLNINNFSTTAELFIFSNKKNKNIANKNNSGSVLLSLNLAYLGKLDAYIYKNNNDISCQFRLEKESAKNLIKENTLLLIEYLKSKKLILKELSFKDLDESFSLYNSALNKNMSQKNDIKISSFSAKA